MTNVHLHSKDDSGSSETTRSTTPVSLIDEAMPRWDAVERHEIRTRASPARAWEAGRALDVSRSLVIRALFALRSLGAIPTVLRTGRLPEGKRLGTTRESLLRGGFVLLGEREGEEMLLGLVGRFWTPSGGIERLDAAEFRAWDRPGYARATWNFTIRAEEDGGARIATETRVLCTDEASRRSFLRYWRVIGPFSGLTRRIMLRSLKRAAEG